MYGTRWRMQSTMLARSPPYCVVILVPHVSLAECSHRMDCLEAGTRTHRSSIIPLRSCEKESPPPTVILHRLIVCSTWYILHVMWIRSIYKTQLAFCIHPCRPPSSRSGGCGGVCLLRMDDTRRFRFIKQFDQSRPRKQQVASRQPVSPGRGSCYA